MKLNNGQRSATLQESGTKSGKPVVSTDILTWALDFLGSSKLQTWDFATNFWLNLPNSAQIDSNTNRNTLFLLPSHITLPTQRRLHSFLVWVNSTKFHPLLEIIPSSCALSSLDTALLRRTFATSNAGFSEKSTWLSCDDEIYKVATIFRDSSIYYPQRTISYQVCVAIFWPSRARLQQIGTEASKRFVSTFWQPWNSTRLTLENICIYISYTFVLYTHIGTPQDSLFTSNLPPPGWFNHFSIQIGL